MPSRRRLRISRRASRDLVTILEQSLELWGEEQEIAYTADLTASMQRLLEYPELGRARDDILPGLRTLPVRQHVILYRTTRTTVRILRIIHRRMDIQGQVDT